MRLKRKKPAQATQGAVTRPYMPTIMEQVLAKKNDLAMETLGAAACDYFARFSKVIETISVADAAIMVKLFRHMADEMERADPQAAKIVKTLQNIKLPPIEYRRQQ